MDALLLALGSITTIVAWFAGVRFGAHHGTNAAIEELVRQCPPELYAELYAQHREKNAL